MQSTTRVEEVRQLLLSGPETPWQKYCELAARTESVPNNVFEKVNAEKYDDYVRATRLLHAALGICTEVIEYDCNDGTQRNIAEELGDVLWYLAIIENEFKIPPIGELGFGINFSLKGLFYLGEIQDVIKRHIFYGTAIDMNRLYVGYHGLQQNIATELKGRGIDQIDCMAANIVKLEKRYPDLCFDSQHAVHRDVENELSHIPGAPNFGEAIQSGLENNSHSTYTYADVLTKDAKIPSPGESLLLGRAEFITGTEAPLVEDINELFKGSAVIFTGYSFNDYLKSQLSPDQLEKLAMDICFSTAEYYRGVGAVSIARGYDSMYREYSGKGNKLDDLSVFIMWRDLGYGLREDQILSKLAELGYETT